MAPDLTRRSPVAAVVLAAGEGSRFKGPTHKLRAPFRGRPLVTWVFDAVAQAGFERNYVVTGAVELDDLIPDGWHQVVAIDWAEGQSRTLQAAVQAAGADGFGAIVVGLGDQPLVPASAWRSVGAARGAIAAASFEGKLRPPVKLERSVWPELPVHGDQGARGLIRERPDLVSAILCTGNPMDIDTKEELARWNSRTNSSSIDPSTKPGRS